MIIVTIVLAVLANFVVAPLVVGRLVSGPWPRWSRPMPRPWRCDACDLGFTTARMFAAHQRGQHPETFGEP